MTHRVRGGPNPPYAADIRRATGRPVFDIVSLVRLAHDGLADALGPRPA